MLGVETIPEFSAGKSRSGGEKKSMDGTEGVEHAWRPADSGIRGGNPSTYLDLQEYEPKRRRRNDKIRTICMILWSYE